MVSFSTARILESDKFTFSCAPQEISSEQRGTNKALHFELIKIISTISGSTKNLGLGSPRKSVYQDNTNDWKYVI